MPSGSTQTRYYSDNRLKPGGRIMLPGRKKKMRRRKHPIKKPKYKGAKGNTYQPAANVEIFQHNVESNVVQFRDNVQNTTAGSETPANTMVILPAGWNSDTVFGEHFINGKYFVPKFLNTKLSIGFQNIVPDHADSAGGFVLDVHVVQVKIAPHKVNPDASSADYATMTDYGNFCEKLVKRELLYSQLTADFCAYVQKSRNLNILNSFRVVPNNNGRIRTNISPGTTGEAYTAPPRCQYSIDFPMTGRPSQVVPIHGNSDLKVANSLWIPAIVMTCKSLTSNTGTFDVRSCSRMWWSDP